MEEEEESEKEKEEEEEKQRERRGKGFKKLVKRDEGVRGHKGRYPALCRHKGRKSVRRLITTGAMKGGEKKRRKSCRRQRPQGFYFSPERR